MLVLCAGAKANARGDDMRKPAATAFALTPAQRTTAHALPLSGAAEAPHRSLRADQSSSGPRKSARSASISVLSISF